MDDIFTYLIVMCDDKTAVRSAQRLTHRKGLHATITLVLEIRGVNVVTNTLKIPKLRCNWYCTNNHGTLYAQPGTRVFGAQEKAIFEQALVYSDSLELHIIHSVRFFCHKYPL